MIWNRVYRKLNVVNSFSNSVSNIKEMITYFKEVNKKSKTKYKKYKLLSTLLKIVDSFVVFASTSSYLTLSLTELVLIRLPISTGITRSLSLSIEINMR